MYTYNANTKQQIKQIIRQHFYSTWRKNLQDLQKYPILRLYKLLKNDFGREKYLTLVSKKKYRIAISRLRASSHNLEIERGRYTIPVTPIENRLCSVCNSIEDEFHFLLHCQLYNEERSALFHEITNIEQEFSSLTDRDRLIFLLSNENSQILTWVGKFVYNSFTKRNEYYSSL